MHQAASVVHVQHSVKGLEDRQQDHSGDHRHPIHPGPALQGVGEQAREQGLAVTRGRRRCRQWTKNPPRQGGRQQVQRDEGTHQHHHHLHHHGGLHDQIDQHAQRQQNGPNQQQILGEIEFHVAATCHRGVGALVAHDLPSSRARIEPLLVIVLHRLVRAGSPVKNPVVEPRPKRRPVRHRQPRALPRRPRWQVVATRPLPRHVANPPVHHRCIRAKLARHNPRHVLPLPCRCHHPRLRATQSLSAPLRPMAACHRPLIRRWHRAVVRCGIHHLLRASRSPGLARLRRGPAGGRLRPLVRIPGQHLQLVQPAQFSPLGHAVVLAGVPGTEAHDVLLGSGAVEVGGEGGVLEVESQVPPQGVGALLRVVLDGIDVPPVLPLGREHQEQEGRRNEQQQ
mmetsp:Transcript_86439/g.231577  ORF Transcript_86439/g.231577 Transcript_86439/m.231577 type:complete len:396 (-) Transcript_86439:1063-2250(-)